MDYVKLKEVMPIPNDDELYYLYFADDISSYDTLMLHYGSSTRSLVNSK